MKKLGTNRKLTWSDEVESVVGVDVGEQCCGALQCVAAVVIHKATVDRTYFCVNQQCMGH